MLEKRSAMRGAPESAFQATTVFSASSASPNKCSGAGLLASPSMKMPFFTQGKRRDVDVETFAPFERDELVRAAHRAERRVERAARRVLEALARTEPGLLADDARAAHLFDPTVRVGNDPMPVQQLNRFAAVVRDADGIEKEVLAPGGVRAFG